MRGEKFGRSPLVQENLRERAPDKMPSSRTKAAVAAVAVAALAASAGAAAASNRKLLQRPDEGAVLGSAAELALDLDFLSGVGGADNARLRHRPSRLRPRRSP